MKDFKQAITCLTAGICCADSIAFVILLQRGMPLLAVGALVSMAAVIVIAVLILRRRSGAGR